MFWNNHLPAHLVVEAAVKHSGMFRDSSEAGISIGKASSCWTKNGTEVEDAQPELHLKHTHNHTIIEGGQWCY